jgi:hypothetical protein
MTQAIHLGDRQLIAHCSAQHDPGAHRLLENLARVDADGPPLAPGSKIDYGWALLQIEAHGEDWLVCEPDFESEPMHWLPSVDATLGVLEAQAEFVQRFGVAPQPTRADRTLWLMPDAATVPCVYLHRTPPDSPGDSGWYVGCDVDSGIPGQRATRVPAGRLLSRRPALVAALAMPLGYLLRFEGDELVEVIDDAERVAYERQKS